MRFGRHDAGGPAGKDGHINYDAIAGIIYTNPELAGVGLTEEQAKEKGIDYRVGRFPFRATGRAVANEDLEGVAKFIADAKTAAQYRQSFGYYTENRLLVSMFIYATMSALFSGIFIVRYRVELILFVPLAAGFFGYYLKLGLQQDSPAQHPEKLYRERGFVRYLVVSMVVLVLLMLVQVPALYDLFNIESARMDPLWTIGPRVK